MIQSQLRQSLHLIEVKPGLKFSLATLKAVLPDVETTLFFAKLYQLNAAQLSNLLAEVHKTTVVLALTSEGGGHSTVLQDYIVELGYETLINSGEISFGSTQPKGEILPEIWAQLEVTVAKSIAEVAEKLKDVVGTMPGKQGEMVFRSLMAVNAKRPILGDYKAHIHHARQRPNLVVLDVSGSMSEHTIKTIVDDVVALSYMANAHLAIVSNTSTHWGPGEYDTDVVLKAAEYQGTHYETLAELFNQDWGVVVAIADYDSSTGAKEAIARCRGKIETLLDISLVHKPTFLGEVLGQLANDVQPVLIAQSDLTHHSYSW